MYKCKMTEIFYKNSSYYYSSKPRQQVHNNQGMDFYLKYRQYTIIKQCKKKSPTCHVVLFKRYYVVYHHLTLKKCCKCLMFNTILPDNVPRASFIYVRRLQLRMNINEHPLIRNTTLFCLKQYIYMNQLYKLSDSMCSVA